MVRNRLYYSLKPLIPWPVRTAVRRWFAQRKRERVRDVWPILPGSERPPAGWSGWPDGKQFAFVLTHDVESPEGLRKVKQLAELEMSLGFRSCFNFIPEGDYEVPSELRQWLASNGFEVGVHDLKHDGYLFSSRKEFERCAPRINGHILEWGAAGFRSGFMLRNLEWLHELNIQYDASTFDTDPFEPQPDGVGTIFPFFVPGPNLEPGIQNPEHSARIARHASRSGYVELPYTLPQDSTLFLVLGEPTSEIWTRKLDWIAEQGGMANVNVHPDYLQFAGEPSSARTYSFEHYVALLRHARDVHAGHSWNGLPQHVAAFTAASFAQSSSAPSVATRHVARASYIRKPAT